MILSKEEAICLVLGLSKDHVVSSITKLNKLLATLNLHLIPIDVDFKLNKYGSHDAELTSIQETEFFKTETYAYADKTPKKVILKPAGNDLFKKTEKKLEYIFDSSDFDHLKKEIHELSMLTADQISQNEHQKLLVDIDDRFKLEQKLNEINADMIDVYGRINELTNDNIADIKLKALIEYCYFLAKYLREIRFKHIIDSEEYDYDAEMLDYYYVRIISDHIPFFKAQLDSEQKDEKKINKLYQYLVDYAEKKNYSFSLSNKKLFEIIRKCQ